MRKIESLMTINSDDLLIISGLGISAILEFTWNY